MARRRRAGKHTEADQAETSRDLDRAAALAASPAGGRSHARTGCSWSLVGAVAEIALTVVLDVGIGRSGNGTSGFAIAALVAAVGVGPTAVAAVGLAATAATIPTGFLTAPLWATSWTVGWVVAGSVIGIVAAVKRIEREANLGRASRLAAAAQGVMLRPPPSRLGPCQLAPAMCWRPSRPTWGATSTTWPSIPAARWSP